MKILEGHIPFIEKALDIKLYEYQRMYLLNLPTTLPGGRANGRTLILCVRLALSEGEPLDMRKPEEFSDMQHFSKSQLMTYARSHFRYEFLRIRDRLLEHGFKVRDIKN